MGSFIKVLFILSVFVYPLSALAFKADFHEQVTELAMSHYRTCQHRAELGEGEQIIASHFY